MGNVNDSTGITADLRNARQRLADADIDERDRAAITAYVAHRDVQGGRSGSYAPSTERDDLDTLRCASERADTPLLDMNYGDVVRFLRVLTADEPPKDDAGRTWRSTDYTGLMPGEDGYGYGMTSGVGVYHDKLRPFYDWLNDSDEHGGSYPWWSKIKAGESIKKKHAKRGSKLDRKLADRDHLTTDEIDAMRDAVSDKPRDLALVSFFAATGARRTLVANLRREHLRFDHPDDIAPAAFRPNPEGEGQKGVSADTWYPITDYIADIRAWVNRQHPASDDPRAPLWPPLHYDPDDPDPDDPDAAINSRQVARRLKRLGERAGIRDARERVTPHAFRHSAVGRWKSAGYHPSEVQRRTAWADGTAANLWGRYGEADTDTVDRSIAEKEGLDPGPPAEDDTPTTTEPMTCPNCRATDQEGDHCSNCGAPVSDDAKREAAAAPTGGTERAPEGGIVVSEGELEDLIDAAIADRLTTSHVTPGADLRRAHDERENPDR